VPTRFFCAHANTRRHQNHFLSLQHQDQLATDEDSMVTIAFDIFNEVLGTATPRSNSINLDVLDQSQLNPDGLGARFTEEEVWNIIRTLPPNKALGPDRFTTKFLHVA
jgi:hypothetical protein